MQRQAKELRSEKAESVVAWAHDQLGLSYADVGDAIGASRRSVIRWRTGAAIPRRDNERRLARLDEFRFWLAEVFGEDREAMARWLSTRVRDLDGKTPMEALLAGNIENVIGLLATYETGAFV